MMPMWYIKWNVWIKQLRTGSVSLSQKLYPPFWRTSADIASSSMGGTTFPGKVSIYVFSNTFQPLFSLCFPWYALKFRITSSSSTSNNTFRLCDVTIFTLMSLPTDSLITERFKKNICYHLFTYLRSPISPHKWKLKPFFFHCHIGHCSCR